MLPLKLLQLFYFLIFSNELDLIYELMLFRWRGSGNESWIWCNELLQKTKGVLEERKNYTCAIEVIGKVIDVGDPVVGATFWHDYFYVHAIALFNVWLHILCPPYR